MRALVALMKEAERDPPEKMPPRASRWLRFMRWFGLAAPHRTCVWCPTCGNEMTTCPDTKHHEFFAWLPSDEPEPDGVVAYVCAACATGSLWDFTAPVPLLLEYTTPGFGPEWAVKFETESEGE